MKNRVLSLLLCLFLVIGILPVTAWAATQISSVTITNVPTPYAGSKVPIAATVNTTGAQLYSLDWYDKTAGRFLESTDYFTENHVYEVQLWVEAKSGYEFRTNGAVPNVAATVGGKTATVSKAYEYQAWAMVVVSYTFEPCGKMEIKSADLQLEGITKSGNVLRVEQGQYVPFSIQSGDEKVALYPQLHTRYYPYGFRWTNSTKDTVAYQGDRFQGGCDYYVTIALKPRDSAFTFADDFTATIGGKSAQIRSLGKTYAEISVEVTCFGSIGGNDIRPVVILPKDGNAPNYGVTYAYPQCKNIDYASVEGWYDVQTGERITSYDTFVGGKQYRVEICCTAAYAYKFQRDANDEMEYTPMITGWDVDSYRFGYDDYRGRELIYITKTFTAETRDHICTAGPWQCDESGHKNYCITCGTALAGGAHWSNEDATCAQKAKCTVCGYGYGELENHKWGSKYHPVDASGHALQCADCKGYDTRKPHTPGPAATETTPQTCTECGYVIEPAKNHTHTPSGWRTTGIYHFKACTTCGEFLEQEDHKGGIATCSAKGKCTVCGYAYIEENEKHNPDTSKWTACGNLYHAHLCKDCGAHCDTQDHIAGPAGTPDAAVVCKDCGYIITPAKDHKHKLTKVAKKEATCTEPGNTEYYTCDGCSDFFADSEGKTKITDTVIAPLGHKISDGWKYDESNHWRFCQTCQTVMEETNMHHDILLPCATCGYVEGAEIEPDVPEQTTQPIAEETEAPTDPAETRTPDAESKDKGKQKDKGLDWLSVILIGIACLLVAFSVTVAVVVLIKKKK